MKVKLIAYTIIHSLSIYCDVACLFSGNPNYYLKVDQQNIYKKLIRYVMMNFFLD